MYTRQEESRQRQAFWTTFGQYMQPVTPADGAKVNWVNYKTGVPGINFKMEAGTKEATIAIVLSNSNIAVQHAHYDQLLRLRSLLHTTLGEEWTWQPPMPDEYGRMVSTVSLTIADVNINRNEDWQALISFFKPRLVALDAFWSMARFGFDC